MFQNAFYTNPNMGAYILISRTEFKMCNYYFDSIPIIINSLKFNEGAANNLSF